ncbi:hypothetical protein BD289DRAFT_480599 [Coniella lustricola]|uniref:Zn(2)-C6 fungal-type domain-containing protein n=1 Tax=Coniella lustricola TaxID=2025994 RepID=A0A2T3AEW3_9PEZI|nr:hypothetical protein BD289DRAFT_480599 [Coniella lustricola]
MGMLSTYYHQQHRAAPTPRLPDTPPELVSPSSSTYSSIPSEGHPSWGSRSSGPLSPPMSSYDHPYASSISKVDMGRKSFDSVHHHHHQATASHATRQQLPSLSSLFPPNMRSLPSPRSERPSYSAASPLDPPRSAGGYLERTSSSSSYFPPASASASATTRTVYEPKLFDNRAVPPLAPQPKTAFPGPLTPGAREPASRADPSHRWTIHQDMVRGSESSFGARDHATGRYQTQPLAGQKHAHECYFGSNTNYRTEPPAPQQQQPQQQHYPPPQHASQYASHQQSPASATGETIATKDGLGPKIWTGTHFLPRFVRAAEVTGEGMCYFYDDGSHCKTVIDGEAVNAHWGVTKAGKPRKRLAIACVTCREKKIKCDPDYPRCVQCEKFGRVCKFKNAPRGGGHHNNSPSTPLDERDDSPPRQRAPFDYPRSRHSPSVSPRTTELPLMLSAPPKRIKYESEYRHTSRPDDRRDPAASSSWPQQHGLAGQLPLPRVHDEAYRSRYTYPDTRPDTRV